MIISEPNLMHIQPIVGDKLDNRVLVNNSGDCVFNQMMITLKTMVVSTKKTIQTFKRDMTQIFKHLINNGVLILFDKLPIIRSMWKALPQESLSFSFFESSI